MGWVTVGSMTSQQPDVLVIGAGVSGLTTAICLAEAGCGVTVAAAQRTPLITSAAAGAIWGPHLVGIDERVTGWGAVTLARFAELANDPASGVHLASGITASADHRAEPFGWVGALGSASACDPADLPDGYAAGWRLTAPIVSMPVYLGYLMARLDRAGGQLREAEFGSLTEAAALTTAPVIVNCSGIGARRLVPDPDVTPVRGQVVVTGNPGLSEFFIGVGEEPGEVSYYFPHGDVAVLGGTEEMGNWSLEPDPATAERILRACAAVQPRLRGATAAEHRVGLRPWRPSVRLEAEALDGGRTLVHNYGHGGAGVTLSWGCALEVTAAVVG
jgi:D-amino-acid oxidase